MATGSVVGSVSVWYVPATGWPVTIGLVQVGAVLVVVLVEVLVDVVWDVLVDVLVDVEVDVLVELVVTGALVEVDVLVEDVVTGALVEVDVLVEDVATGALVEVDVLVELVVTGVLDVVVDERQGLCAQEPGPLENAPRCLAQLSGVNCPHSSVPSSGMQQTTFAGGAACAEANGTSAVRSVQTKTLQGA